MWKIALLVLLLVGGGLRASVAANPYIGHHSSDEYDYERIALSLYESATYGRGSTIQRAPGAPVLFALANAVRPSTSTSDTAPTKMDIPAAYWAQAAVGTALVAVVWLLGLALGGLWTAAVAAAAVAVYPPLVRGAGELLSEPLGTLLLTAAIVLVLAATKHPTTTRWALAGVVLGLANLTRPDFVFLPLVLAAIVCIADKHVKPRMLVAFVAASALTIAPWSAYVSLRAGHPVAVTTGDGAALYIGTSPIGGGTSTGLKRAYDRDRLQDVFKRVAPTRSLDGQDSKLRAKAIENLWFDLRHPRRFVPMVARKQRHVWWHTSNPGQRPRPAWMLPLHQGLLLIGLLGVAAGAFALRGRARLLLALTVAPVAYVAVLHIVMPAEPRFNVPVMPLLIAAGLTGAVALARESRRFGESAMSF